MPCPALRAQEQAEKWRLECAAAQATIEQLREDLRLHPRAPYSYHRHPAIPAHLPPPDVGIFAADGSYHPRRGKNLPRRLTRFAWLPVGRGITCRNCSRGTFSRNGLVPYSFVLSERSLPRCAPGARHNLSHASTKGMHSVHRHGASSPACSLLALPSGVYECPHRRVVIRVCILANAPPRATLLMTLSSPVCKEAALDRQCERTGEHRVPAAAHHFGLPAEPPSRSAAEEEERRAAAADMMPDLFERVTSFFETDGATAPAAVPRPKRPAVTMPLRPERVADESRVVRVGGRERARFAEGSSDDGSSRAAFRQRGKPTRPAMTGRPQLPHVYPT